MVFSKKNILIPNVAEKNILILVEEKNNNLIQSFCHITFKFWKKKFMLCATKKINIPTLVFEKKILNETKNHNPSFKLNGRSLSYNDKDKYLGKYIVLYTILCLINTFLGGRECFHTLSFNFYDTSYIKGHCLRTISN